MKNKNKKAFSPPPSFSVRLNIVISRRCDHWSPFSKAKHPWIISFVWHYFTGCGDGQCEHGREEKGTLCLGVSRVPSRTAHWGGDGRTHPAPHYIHIFVFLSLPHHVWMDGQTPKLTAQSCPVYNRCSRLFFPPCPCPYVPSCPVQSVCVACEGGVEIHVLQQKRKGANLTKAYGGAFFFLSFFWCGALQYGCNLPPKTHPSYTDFFSAAFPK